MGSWRNLVFLSHILLNVIGLSISQPDFLCVDCSSGFGNYTANSLYQTNLKTLLSSLSSNTDSYGFYNSSLGENPDRVSAIVLCRGDVDLDTCRGCINNSTSKITQVCPNSKMAVGWYDLCMCTPDLSELDCSNCLQAILADIQSYIPGSEGGRILSPSCGLRFDNYLFFSEIPVDSPPPVDSTAGIDVNRTRTVIFIVVSTIASVIALIIFMLIYLWKCKQRMPRDEVHGSLTDILPSKGDGNTGLPFFNVVTIAEATSNFSLSNKIGEGGFGPVFKGQLSTGQLIAVKRNSKKSNQGLREFKNEVILIAKLQHWNLVRLLGCCIEGEERMLIYDGYMAPEYVMDGLFSMKSDVYSFGVLVLEIVSGKRTREFYHHDHSLTLLRHVWKLWIEGKVLVLLNEQIDDFPIPEALKCIQVGLLCVQHHPEDRPTMSSVLLALDSEIATLPQPKEPGFYAQRSSNETEPPLSGNQITTSNELTLTVPSGR
ncbi:hypothetical protein RHSIM_Rhsim02G0112900 [Rhododendron simsii]|uniref:non-specific serine/threonine protein kinase n=1 Tax=Rhododendron simsii TaxID=118357 RepID=A0A834HGJ4_RHOSS|nr:hypothetical protein RHSIM_Rhsim02G0112900 [Rhododendron simsii]